MPTIKQETKFSKIKVYVPSFHPMIGSLNKDFSFEIICAVSVKNAVNVHIFLSKWLQVGSASITFNCRIFYDMLVGVFADNNAFQIFKALHFQVLWFALM